MVFLFPIELCKNEGVFYKSQTNFTQKGDTPKPELFDSIFKSGCVNPDMKDILIKIDIIAE